jgi:hypothetical protein
MVLRNPDHKKQRAFPVLRTAAGVDIGKRGLVSKINASP